MSELVSVVLVNFNSGDCIEQCVGSLLNSTIAVELIVVDNASSDRSAANLGSHCDSNGIKIIINNTNRGFATAVNQGIRESSTNFILILNPDCIVERDTLEKMLVVMKENPTAGMAGGLILNYDGTEQRGCRRKIPTPKSALVKMFGLTRVLSGNDKVSGFELDGSILPKEAVKVEAISGAFMLVSRIAMDKVGLMDEDYFLHCEDLDWCYRFTKAGYKILFNPNINILHFKGQSSNTRQIRVYWHMHNGMVRFFRKFYRKDYILPVRIMVYGGIWVRFVIKCFVVILRRLVFIRGKNDINRDIGVAISNCGGGHSIIKSNIKEVVLISGATSIVGSRLIDKLLARDYQVVAISRNPQIDGLVSDVIWITPNPVLVREYVQRFDIVNFVHLAPIWVLPKYLGMLTDSKIKKIISLSSTSVLSKTTSVDHRDRTLARRLRDGEDLSEKSCGVQKIDLVILRPTLIYGDPRDGNLSNIIRFIQWFGFYPIVGRGGGLRQPIHVNEVADSCFAILNTGTKKTGTYAISGGEVLSYKQMVTRIFKHLGKKPLILSLPLNLFRFCIDMMTKVGVFTSISPSMADRMNCDLCFDHSRAMRDFDFNPGKFTYG